MLMKLVTITTVIQELKEKQTQIVRNSFLLKLSPDAEVEGADSHN